MDNASNEQASLCAHIEILVLFSWDMCMPYVALVYTTFVTICEVNILDYTQACPKIVEH